MTPQRFSYTPMPPFLRGMPLIAVPVTLTFDPFSPIELAFAWIDVPQTKLRVLLGQINFFQYFKITFTAYEEHFEISSRR